MFADVAADVVATRADDAAVLADVEPAVVRVAERDTTRRGADSCSVLVITFIGLEP